MSDIFDKKTRSRIMAAIKEKGNRSTEQRMVEILKLARLKGWRRHLSIPGTPDFCWPNYKVALFVDGCFWHGCPRCYRAPLTNKGYWRDKLNTNKRRDRQVDRQLRNMGWSIIHVWECRIHQRATISRINKLLLKRGWGADFVQNNL